MPDVKIPNGYHVFGRSTDRKGAEELADEQRRKGHKVLVRVVKPTPGAFGHYVVLVNRETNHKPHPTFDYLLQRKNRRGGGGGLFGSGF